MNENYVLRNKKRRLPETDRKAYVLSITSELFFGISFDGLFAVGTYGHNLDGHTQLLFEEG